MTYKIGDQVLIEIEILQSGIKRILLNEPEEESQIEEKYFTIVAFLKDKTYKIIIDDDIRGWHISKYHIEYENVDEKYFGKKFYDIPENFILNKK